jgi:CheY-like chemotaxis protein
VSEQVAIAVDRKHSEEARKISEETNKTLFEISNAVNTTRNLEQLCKSIHKSLLKVINVKNFSLSLYDKEADRLNFLYRCDETNSPGYIENVSQSSSLIFEVVRKGKLLLLDEQGQKKLIKKLGGELIGKWSKSWLCVPLKAKNETIGTILSQNYTTENCYKKRDIELLTLVSGQIALAIERKQTEEALMHSEAQLKIHSDQMEQFSLAAASMIAMKNEQKTYSGISKAIVEHSDYKRVIISFFNDTPPYREIIGYAGVDEETIKNLKKLEMPKTWFNKIFEAAIKIGQFSYYVPHTKKHLLKQEATDFGKGTISKDENAWHPEDKLSTIFEPFKQVDGSTTRKYGGMGLGLSICKKISELMGGEVWAKSEANKGSTFHFTAWLKKVEDKKTKRITPVSLSDKKILVVDDNLNNLKILTHNLESPISNAPLIALSSLMDRDAKKCEKVGFDGFLSKPIQREKLYQMLAKLLGEKREECEKEEREKPKIVTQYSVQEDMKHSVRILLAEDNPVNQKLAKLMLTKAGYQVEVANNGREAVEKFTSSPEDFDLIFMDIQMPKMDGLEATQAIRSKGFDTIPIVAMTANAMKGDREICLEAGMNDYTTKPIKRDIVFGILEKFVFNKDA